MTDQPNDEPTTEQQPRAGNDDRSALELRVKLLLGSIGFLFLLALFAAELVTKYQIDNRTLAVLVPIVLAMLGLDEVRRLIGGGGGP